MQRTRSLILGSERIPVPSDRELLVVIIVTVAIVLTALMTSALYSSTSGPVNDPTPSTVLQQPSEPPLLPSKPY